MPCQVTETNLVSERLQSCEFLFCLNQQGNLRVSVFPDCKEGPVFRPGLIELFLPGQNLRQVEMSQSMAGPDGVEPGIGDDKPVIRSGFVEHAGLSFSPRPHDWYSIIAHLVFLRGLK